MALVLLRTPSYTLYIVGEDELRLHTLAQGRITKVYSAWVGEEWEKCPAQAGVLQLKTWFDEVHELISYIQTPEPNRISLDPNTQLLHINVRVRKGTQRFAKIGCIRMNQRDVTMQTKLQWIYTQCSASEPCQKDQLLNFICMVYCAIDQVAINRSYQKFDHDRSRQLVQLLKQAEQIQNVAEKYISDQYLSLKHQSEQYQVFQSQKLAEIEELTKLVEELQNGKEKLNKTKRQKELPTQTGPDKQSLIQRIKHSQQNGKMERILRHIINTDSPYFRHFSINNTEITLRSPGYSSNSPIMFTYRHRVTDIIKYALKIRRMKKRMAFGVVDQAHCNKARCFARDSVIKYGSNGTYTYTNSFPKSGHPLSEGQTITVTADLKKGDVKWESGSIVVFSSKADILLNSNILWVPYIELLGENDAVEWVGDPMSG